MSTQYRLVQSGKTASGGCSAGPRFVRACSATDYYIIIIHSVILMGVYNILHSISSARTYGKKEGIRKIIKIYL
jgi:hypothetical protein